MTFIWVIKRSLGRSWKAFTPQNCCLIGEAKKPLTCEPQPKAPGLSKKTHNKCPDMCQNCCSVWKFRRQTSPKTGFLFLKPPPFRLKAVTSGKKCPTKTWSNISTHPFPNQLQGAQIISRQRRTPRHLEEVTLVPSERGGIK